VGEVFVKRGALRNRSTPFRSEPVNGFDNFNWQEEKIRTRQQRELVGDAFVRDEKKGEEPPNVSKMKAFSSMEGDGRNRNSSRQRNGEANQGPSPEF